MEANGSSRSPYGYTNPVSGKEYPFPFLANIDCGIDIPVMIGMALRADPFSYRQIFRPFVPIAADVTELRTWIPFVDFYQMFALPCQFIGQHRHKSRPPIISSRFAVMWSFLVMLCHCFDIQALNADSIILIRQYRGFLLQEIFALISNLFMDSGNFQFQLLPVVASFLCTG